MSDTIKWHKWGIGGVQRVGGIPELPDYQAKLGVLNCGDTDMNDELDWLLDEMESLEEIDFDTELGYNPDMIEEYNMLGVFGEEEDA